ncbi:kptA [Symbiodinium sp. CCMP2592]|nr:kptA [Symbiodinium sp. CCMP2592]
MQRLKSVLDNPAGEAERKSQEADLSESPREQLFADSGPLLGPPPSWLPKSLSKEAEEAAEPYLRKVHQAGTTLLRLCGGWKEAVGALRYAWRTRGEDHFAELFDHHLDSHLPEDLLAWVRRVAQEGVKAEYRGTQRARVKATPHPSLKDHVEEARQLIWQDATRGRVLLMSPGPDEEDLLDGVVSVPLARVPKYNPDRSVSSKGRVIWDARVVNELCHKDDHFPAIQPRYAEVVRLVMWYKSRYPGVRVLLAKKDVSEAFKWLWVEQDDCRLFGADLPTEGATRDSRGDASRPVTVLYLAMTFGWTGAPGEFMAFAWAIKLLHRACGPDRPEWHDSSSFRSLALMDDSVVIEPDLGLRPQLSVDALEEAIRQTLGPLAINAAKDVEEGTLTTRKLIWGLEFDTEAGTCRLPPLKVERAYHVLQSRYFDAGQTKVPLKEVQVLRGSQQFWLGVLPQLAPYLQSTNALLGPADREGHVVLRGNEAEQSAQWEAFWSAIELQRLLVGSRQFWEARFVSQLEHALTTPELLALPEVKRNLVWVSADATPTRLGAIANAQDSTDLEARTEPEEDLVQIGSVVLYLGDNTNVQDWLRKRQAGNAQANHLLKVLGALEGVHGLQVRGAYLRTYHNQTADDLTRLDPDKVMEQQRLTRLSVPDDWGRVLEEAWRIGPAPPRAMPAFGWKVHELGASEHGVYTRAFFAAGGLKHDPQDSSATLEGAPTVERSAPGEEAASIWIDSFRPLAVEAICTEDAQNRWEWWTEEFTGRTFKEQVHKLLGGRGWDATDDDESDARLALHAPPYALAAFAAEFVGSLPPDTSSDRSRFSSEGGGALPSEGKAGACELPWEDDAEALVRLWLGGKLEGRSETRCSGMGGKGNQKGKGAHNGRRDQEKLERLRGSFRARSDADRRRLVKILRHEDLNECVGTISGEDAARIIGRDEKDRLILSQEGEEVWVAAVSGHTIAGVVGPGRELPLQEVPEVLVHGSYARHSNNILKEGLHARRAIHLLSCGSKHGRWRSDIETSVFVLAREAARYAQVRFLLTTNDIYLAPDGIPPEYISQIESWRKGPVPFPPRAAGSSVGRSAPGTAAGSRREGAAKTAAEKAQQRAEAVAEHKEAARFTERQEARRKLASAAPRGTVGVGSGEEKSELVENLTSLAQAFSKNRDACAQAATSRAATLAELEGAEAAYFAALSPALAELERKNPVRPSMDKSVGWINHARFLQDKEAAGVWVARRKEKSRLRAAAHRAAQQTAEGGGAGVQDPVRDQADAASHLNFQMNEAARDNLRRFQAELRAGEL